MTADISALRAKLVEVIKAAEIAGVYAESAAEIDQLEDKLNVDVNQSVLVENISALANKSGVTVISESYEVGNALNGYIPLYQEIALEGAYQRIRQFLLGVHELPTWTVVLESRLESSRNSRAIKAMLTLVTYQKS